MAAEGVAPASALMVLVLTMVLGGGLMPVTFLVVSLGTFTKVVFNDTLVTLTVVSFEGAMALVLVATVVIFNVVRADLGPRSLLVTELMKP